MLEEFSGFPFATCVFFALVICFYQGGQLGLFFWLLWRVKRQGFPILWLAAPIYGASELVYPLLFPSYLANCLHELPSMVHDIRSVGSTS